MESDAVTFSTKKQLFLKLINENGSLKGKAKAFLDKYLKKIMELRNALAHGELVRDGSKGWLIEYYSGGIKSNILDDQFWNEIESCFTKTHSLLMDIKKS